MSGIFPWLKRTVMVLALLPWLPAVAPAAPPEAPFGMSWGLTRAQIEARGVRLTVVNGTSTIKVYTAQKLPSTPSKTDAFGLYVAPGVGLQKIRWLSEPITDDPYGNEGKERYAALKKILTEKYGPPQDRYTMERVGLALFQERDEFYQCLRYRGCGLWGTAWSGAFGTVVLRIEGTRQRGKGRLNLDYEGPHWSAAVDRAQEKQASKDKKAF